MTLPPGPDLPAITQTWLWFRKPREFLRDCRERYGDIFTADFRGFGKCVMVSHPPTIKQIFTGDPNVLHAGKAAQTLGPLLGDYSLLLLDGREHVRQRRLMLPSFHGERMREYGSQMLEITERVVAAWPTSGETISLHPHTQEITLDVILRTVFGVDGDEEVLELRDRLRSVLDTGDNPLMSLLFFLQYRPDLGPFTPWAKFYRRLQVADDLIYAQIARRRRELDPSRPDVLTMLLQARDESGGAMGDVELRDELMTLLVAGHETTATSLCWTVERILATPRVYRRIQTELGDVLGGGLLEPSHLTRLEYLDASIKEALRLRPILPMVGRVLQQPMTIHGHEIPAGVAVMPNIYLTHREPDLYPEPDEFRPERFVDKRPDPYEFLPFGGGVRRCLGMAFALYEMRAVLATVFSRVELELAEPAPVDMVRRGITFVPKGGVRVGVKRLRRVVDEHLEGSRAPSPP